MSKNDLKVRSSKGRVKLLVLRLMLASCTDGGSLSLARSLPRTVLGAVTEMTRD